MQTAEWGQEVGRREIETTAECATREEKPQEYPEVRLLRKNRVPMMKKEPPQKRGRRSNGLRTLFVVARCSLAR
jgi:hypothetical protein